MDFLTKLDALVTKNDSLLCIGLDPNTEVLPNSFKDSENAYFEFNKAIIDSTADLVCAYKPNSAFYEARGAIGVDELKKTCDYINEKYPDIPIILDFKRGDIGSTNDQYAKFAFEYLGVDAITIQPYMGKEAVQPFLDQKNKGIIILVRTSNPGSGEFQDVRVEGQKMYLKIAESIVKNWNDNKNCLLVVGATYPDELAEIRQTVGDDIVILIPGIGAQGGDLEATMKTGLNLSGRGVIINSARDIIYASPDSDFAEAARQRATDTRDAINKYRGNYNG